MELCMMHDDDDDGLELKWECYSPLNIHQKLVTKVLDKQRIKKGGTTTRRLEPHNNDLKQWKCFWTQKQRQWAFYLRHV